MHRCFVYAVIFACSVTVFSALAFPQAPPSADAYVTTAMPSANFGSSSILPVQSGTTSYLQLTLATFPANARVAKATLRLYVDAVTAPGSFDVYAINSAWSERGLTASNAPALGASATGGQSIVVTRSSVNQFVLVDITSLAQGWLDGSIANHGVALALTGSDGSFAFDSKESSGHHPELEVVLGDAALVAAGNGQAAAATATNRAISTVAGVSDAPAPGPSPYINNGTTLQTGANFSIDGNGTAAIFNATSQYQLAGAPVLGTNGNQSLFLGAGAGQGNTGGYNTFLGLWAGGTNTTGAGNVFVGMAAGYNNTTGGANTILGYSAGYHNTIGTNNLFFGYASGYSNTTGSQNSFVGVNAGQANTTGNNNFFLGVNAGYNSQSGSSNIFIGNSAGQYVSSGMNNIFLGSNAGSAAGPAATNNVYIASSGAGSDTGVIRIGDPANQTAAYMAGIYGNAPSGALPVVVNANGQLGTTTAGIGVTSFNGRAGAVVPASGDYSFPLLSGVLGSTQIGGTYGNAVTFNNGSNSFNGTFVGNGTGLSGVLPAAGSPNYIQNGTTQQTANFNISGNGTLGGTLGANLINSATTYQLGGNNVLSSTLFNGALSVGIQAGTSGSYNTFVGVSAGAENSGDTNTFVGNATGFSNTTGFGNTYVGEAAGQDGVAGSNNVFVGEAAGYSGYGSQNVFIGSSAGYGAGGDNNVFIGWQAGFSNFTGSQNIYLGVQTNGASGENKAIRIGMAPYQTAAYIAGVYGSTVSSSGIPLYVDANGQLGTIVSSRRFKEQIHDMGESSSALMKLRPVTFLYKPEYDKGPRMLQYGLIAEEVAEVYPDLVAYEPDGKPYTVKYQYLAPMLLNELQKQNAVLSAQQEIIEKLQAQNEEMQQRLSRLEKLLSHVAQ